MRAAASSSASGRWSSRPQSSATAASGLEVGPDRPRSLDEEGSRLRPRRAAAGRARPRPGCAAARGTSRAIRSVGRRRDERRRAAARQPGAGARGCRGRRACAARRRARRSRRRRELRRRADRASACSTSVAVAERRERHEDRPAVGLVGQQASELDREARLARAARADDRQHARIALVDERDRVEELPLAAEEARRRRREVDAPGRAKRRELVDRRAARGGPRPRSP